MNDEVVRLSMIGQVLRRRWPALAAITAAGALVGAAASLVLSPGYTTTSQVLLRDQDAETEFEAHAQLATSSTVLDRTAAALGGDVTGADLLDVVEAEVSEGGLLEITGAAATPRAAQRLTDQAAAEYVTFANELITTTNGASAQVRLERLEALEQQVERTNDRIDRLHGATTQGELTLDSVRARTELESLRKDLAGAMAELESAAATPGEEQPLIIGPAPLPTDTAAPTLPQLAGAGAAAALLFGGFGFLLAARADTRLRDAGEIGAALGIPVTGTIAVPDERPWRGLPRRARAAPADDAATDPQLRRVLTRLAGADDDLRLLLVAADDDPLAHRAVTRLAMAAGAGDTRHTTLRIAHIDPADPVLDDGGDAASALLVLSPGSRTGWELIGIATACADAGHPLAGSVVAQRITRLQAEKTRSEKPARDTGSGNEDKDSDDSEGTVPARSERQPTSHDSMAGSS